MIAVRALGFVCMALWLSACAGAFKADVTRFHQLTGVAPGASVGAVLIQPRDAARAQSLEFNRYADLVGAALARQGFTPPVAGQQPAFVAEIDWDVASTSSMRDDDHGMSVGVGVGGGSHSGVGVGVSTGFSLGGGERVTYIRRLTLVLTRNADNVRVFEGRAVSRGDTTDMLAVMPYLVEAMFKEFPGASGQTVRVSLPRQ